MPLRKLAVQNYRCFRDRQELEIFPVTVALDKSNSGKGALVRAPLVFATAFGVSTAAPLDLERLEAEPVDAFTDLIFEGSVHGNIKVEFDVDGDRPFRLAATMQNVSETRDAFVSALVVGLPETDVSMHWQPELIATGPPHSYEIRTTGGRSRQGAVPFHGLVPAEPPVTELRSWVAEPPSLGMMRYLSPYRERPRRQHRLPLGVPQKLGARGQGASAVLAHDRVRGEGELIPTVNSYLREELDWLLDRLEAPDLWGDQPEPLSMAQLADRVRHDGDFRAVLDLWVGHDQHDPVKTLAGLVADEHVPFLSGYRYEPSGLRKRACWQRPWALQREEDEGKVVTIDVPPKYASADFARGSYWRHRGKLDVPKERLSRTRNWGGTVTRPRCSAGPGGTTWGRRGRWPRSYLDRRQQPAGRRSGCCAAGWTGGAGAVAEAVARRPAARLRRLPGWLLHRPDRHRAGRARHRPRHARHHPRRPGLAMTVITQPAGTTATADFAPLSYPGTSRVVSLGGKVRNDFLKDAAGKGSDDHVRISIRDLIAHWGAKRRGYWIVDQIRRDLKKAGLTTVPPFTDGWIDNWVTLVPAVRKADKGSKKPPASVHSMDLDNQPAPTSDSG
jgi:hypothetical protein